MPVVEQQDPESGAAYWRDTETGATYAEKPAPPREAGWRGVAQDLLGAQAPAVIDGLSQVDGGRDWSADIRSWVDVAKPDDATLNPGNGSSWGIVSEVVGLASQTPGGKRYAAVLPRLDQLEQQQGDQIRAQQNVKDGPNFGMLLAGVALTALTGGFGAVGAFGEAAALTAATEVAALGGSAAGAVTAGAAIPGVSFASVLESAGRSVLRNLATNALMGADPTPAGVLTSAVGGGVSAGVSGLTDSPIAGRVAGSLTTGLLGSELAGQEAPLAAAARALPAVARALPAVAGEVAPVVNDVPTGFNLVLADYQPSAKSQTFRS